MVKTNRTDSIKYQQQKKMASLRYHFIAVSCYRFLSIDKTFEVLLIKSAETRTLAEINNKNLEGLIEQETTLREVTYKTKPIYQSLSAFKYRTLVEFLSTKKNGIITIPLYCCELV
jgi:hypothetical protein